MTGGAMFTSGGKMLSAKETARLLRLTGAERERFIAELVDMMRREQRRKDGQLKREVIE